MTENPPSSEHPLELSAPAMRELVAAALDRIVAHVGSLPTQPVSDTRGSFELAQSLVEALPETGTPVEDLLALLFERAIPPTYNTASPGYLAYIPGGGLFQSAVADLIADSANRYTSVYATAPALAQIEANVIAWFCAIAGYPAAARGTLTSGGSLANWTALVTARRDRLPEDFLAGTIYASDQSHYSVAKGAILAGFPERNVRQVASDERFRMRLDALEARIAEDRAAGLTPFLIVASAGTTNTGAVDPLPELADLAVRHGMWLHVDAAYGGFFLLTEEGRRTLAGIERADSIVLRSPQGALPPLRHGGRAGARRRGAAPRSQPHRRLHAGDAERSGPGRLQPVLPRAVAATVPAASRVWLPFKMHGAGAFRAQLEEKLALARLAHDRLRAMPDVEILAEPQLSLLAFRLAPAGVPEAALEELNQRFLAAVNARQRVFLTATRLRGKFAPRICVLSFRTHRERMEMALEDIAAARAEVLE